MRHVFFKFALRKNKTLPKCPFFMTSSAIFRVYKMPRSTLNREINSLYDKYSFMVAGNSFQYFPRLPV